MKFTTFKISQIIVHCPTKDQTGRMYCLAVFNSTQQNVNKKDVRKANNENVLVKSVSVSAANNKRFV